MVGTFISIEQYILHYSITIDIVTSSHHRHHHLHVQQAMDEGVMNLSSTFPLVVEALSSTSSPCQIMEEELTINSSHQSRSDRLQDTALRRQQEQEQPQTGFQKLLLSMMYRRWMMTLLVLVTFMAIAIGILISIHIGSEVAGEWKELLLLLLGALIGSYGKIIDYWFSDTDKDKMLVQKMDEEDGESLSNTNS